MERKLLAILLFIFFGFALNSCYYKNKPKAELVKKIDNDKIFGEWNFSPTFFNEKMVKKEKSEYWKLSKKNLKIFLEPDGFLKMFNENDKIVDSGNWFFFSYPNDQITQGSVALKFTFVNNSLLSGNYFMTRSNDSLFIFKSIWDIDFDSPSDYVRFLKSTKSDN